MCRVWRYAHADGSCPPVVVGCADPHAANYVPGASGGVECRFLGCTNSLARTFNPSANVDDKSCGLVRGGCTDPGAANYDVFASYDDGSCIRVGCKRNGRSQPLERPAQPPNLTSQPHLPTSRAQQPDE